jgi:hypothetical protein
VAGEGEQGSHDRRSTQALLPPEHREQQRGQWHQRQQDLAESSMDLDEPVIGQPKRAGEVEQTVEQ